MLTTHHDDLQTLLNATRPASILLIDPNPQALPDAYRASHPECRVHSLEGNLSCRLTTTGDRFDLGVVANTLEHMERRNAGILLARLRDFATRRFVALVPIGDDWEGQVSHWETVDLLSYGMTIMARYKLDGKPLHLYHYAIETYKTTPQWFNANHWAHPEQWKPRGS